MAAPAKAISKGIPRNEAVKAIIPSFMNKFPGVIEMIIEKTVSDEMIIISKKSGKTPKVTKLRYSLKETATVTKIRKRAILAISFDLPRKKSLLFANDDNILYFEFRNFLENLLIKNANRIENADNPEKIKTKSLY